MALAATPATSEPAARRANSRRGTAFDALLVLGVIVAGLRFRAAQGNDVAWIHLRREPRTILPQQRGEAGLLEVVVAGQGALDAALLHHAERDAVGQCPRLVRAVEV